MSTELQHAFAEIGARLADDTFGRRFEIDIVMHDGAETYQLRRPWSDSLTIEAQGEWFFLPRPKMRVAEALVERGGRLARDGGKPHHFDELHRVAGRDETFVRGRVRHVDHQTIVLDVWHRVVQNNEVVPAEADQRLEELQRIAWLD